VTAKLVILDRDGVINHDSDQFIKSADEWLPIDGSLHAISRLNNIGFKVVIVTNQSGIARDLFDLSTLDAIHHKMHGMLAKCGGKIEEVVFCPHGPLDGCECRKPAPGMLLEIASRLNLKLENVPVVGDSLRDLEAASAVGAQPILVKTGKGLKTMQDPRLDHNIPIYKDLAEFTDHFIESITNTDSGEK